MGLDANYELSVFPNAEENLLGRRRGRGLTKLELTASLILPSLMGRFPTERLKDESLRRDLVEIATDYAEALLAHDESSEELGRSTMKEEILDAKEGVPV